jgi:hypothetical protein
MPIAQTMNTHEHEEEEDVILAKELEAAGQEVFGSSSSMEVEPTDEEIQNALNNLPKPDFPALKRQDVAVSDFGTLAYITTPLHCTVLDMLGIV